MDRGVELSEEELGQWEALQGELEPLIESGSVSQALERLTALLDTVGKEGRLRPYLLVKRAEVFLDLEDGEEALEDGREALARGHATTEVLGICGWASYHMDKPEKARQYFDRALKVESADVSLLSGRALVLMELEEFDLAVADLSRALQQDEADPAQLWGIRGEVFLRQGEWKRAEKDLRRAWEEDREEPEITLNLARHGLATGNVEKALAVLLESELEGEDLGLEGLLLRSHLRLLSGETRAARADAIRASNLFPDEAFAFVQLATIELAEGNQSLASKAAERAVLLDPSLSDAYTARATARQLAGDQTGAKEDFARANRAPTELPLFLLGPAASFGRAFDPSSFDPSQFAEQFGAAFGQGPEDFDPETAFGKGPIPGMNPMGMLDQIFDSSGNIRGSLRPIFDMALKNAPKFMQNLPPEMQGDLGGLQDLSSEEMEERMKEFYQMLKGGPVDEDEDDEE